MIFTREKQIVFGARGQTVISTVVYAARPIRFETTMLKLILVSRWLWNPGCDNTYYNHSYKVSRASDHFMRCKRMWYVCDRGYKLNMDKILNDESRSGFVLSWKKVLRKRSECWMKLMASQLCSVLLYSGGTVSFHPAVSKIQNKKHVDSFFFWFPKDCAQRICAAGKYCRRRILQKPFWIASVKGDRPALWNDRFFFLLLVPTHTAAIATQFSARKMVSVLDHPLVFTRFKSSRLFSVPEVEDEARGGPFCHDWNNSRSCDRENFKNIPETDFSRAMEKLADRV